MLNNHIQTDATLIPECYLTIIIQNLNTNTRKKIFVCLLFSVCNILINVSVQQLSYRGNISKGHICSPIIEPKKYL